MGTAAATSPAGPSAITRHLEYEARRYFPELGPVHSVQYLRPSPASPYVDFFRIHGVDESIDVAAKRSVWWPLYHDGAVEYTHLRQLAKHSRLGTPRPIAYDETLGVLFSAVVPGVPLTGWLYQRFHSPTARGFRPALAVIQQVGAWLAAAQALPCEAPCCPSYPRLRDARVEAEDGARAGLLAKGLVPLIDRALTVAATDLGPMTWTHGDFGPGNMLLTGSDPNPGLSVVDFTYRFANHPFVDAATFLAWVTVSAALRGQGVRRARACRAAFLHGYRPAGGLDSRETRVLAAQELAATVHFVKRYDRRIAATPRALRGVVRAAVAWVLAARVREYARIALSPC